MAVVKDMPLRERRILSLAFLLASRSPLVREHIPFSIFREATVKVDNFTKARQQGCNGDGI